MTVKLQPGDWFLDGGKWWHMSADGEAKVGPFDTEDDARRSLQRAVVEMFLE